MKDEFEHVPHTLVYQFEMWTDFEGHSFIMSA